MSSSPNFPLEAFKLIDGPCHGEIAELPIEDFDEVYRVTATGTYALYERDGAVFRFAGSELTQRELAQHLSKQGKVKITAHRDSRPYEK